MSYLEMCRTIFGIIFGIGGLAAIIIEVRKMMNEIRDEIGAYYGQKWNGQEWEKV